MVTLAEDGITVLDDVLAPAQFASLNREIGNGEYHSVHERHWNSAWRLWDGDPLRGVPVYYDPTGSQGWAGATYPTSTVVDLLFDAILDVARTTPDLVGAEGIDWNAVFLSPWLYPVGSALTLHHDAGSYSGAFTYFAHTRWSVNWGGELLVLPASSPGEHPAGGASPWLSEDDGIETEVGLGLATCVFPRPNRLVVVGPDRPHTIRRVDVNAGAHVRVSLAGFFLRP